MITDSKFLNNCGLKISYTDKKLTKLITELINKNLFDDFIKAIKLDAYWIIFFYPIERGRADNYLMRSNCPLRQFSEICIYENEYYHNGEKISITHKFMNGDCKDIYDRLSRVNKLKAFL